ncbi:MAG: DUF2339 domain-containing protein [Elusimicrobia bacterium]|nr:DUF2339 domain-containing protein [Elusimicrobiota bacterium]
MAEPENEELLGTIRALWKEIESLRAEVTGLRGDLDRLRGHEDGPVPPPRPASAAPHAPPAPASKLPLPAKKKKGPLVAPLATGDGNAKPSWRLDEKFIGEQLLQYAGIAILALGIVFFLLWTAANAGPEVRVAIAAAAGAALIAAGEKVFDRPPYGRLSGTLIGGGWTVLFTTAYAAYYFPPTRIVLSPQAELGLLLATAGGMVSHAMSRRSRPLRLYAVGLTYFVMLLCGRDVPSFDLFMIVFAASAAVAVGAGEADVLLASLAGYYANYMSVYARVVGMPEAQRSVSNFVAPFVWLAVPYLIVAALPLLGKARERLFRREPSLGEAVLCVNAALFALFAGTMGRIYFGVPELRRAAVLAAFFAVPSVLYARLLSRRSPAASVNAVLALGLLAAAVFAMPNPMWKLLAWIALSCGAVWIGLVLDQAAWRAAGLVLAALTFAFYLNVARLGAESRRAAGMALFVFAALSYGFSRFYRYWLDSPEEWEALVGPLWLHAGSAALVVGLWGVLDAAPFLCALVALALLAEWAADFFDRVDFWKHAVLLEIGLLVYSFFVAYGADAEVLGAPTRLWTAAVVLGGCGYLYASGPVSDELAARWTSVSKREQRVLLSWLTAAATSFAVYRVFDGRLRLAFWALGALALYGLGRERGEEHFKVQGIVLSLVAAVEAVFTYYLYPPQLLSPLTAYSADLYWTACAALLGGLALARGGRTKPTWLDPQAGMVFGALPLVLGACFLAKELDAVRLTLAWTGLGVAFLGAGLALDWRELRYPGLGLLALCILKALLHDTANLPLPSRVASFVALGVVLLVASGLYARAGSAGGS